MKATFTSLLFCLATLTISAQVPNLDIALVDNGNGELEVKVRPDGPFDEVFSSLVFTIRWDASSGANLGTVSQQIPEIIYMPVSKSGAEIDDSGMRYQVFAGFGVQQMNAFSAEFIGGMEITLLTIPVVGMSTFEIVNDSWTGNSANNGDFYASLNGVAATGIIYGGAVSTSIDVNTVANSALVVPNPSTGEVQLQLSNLNQERTSIELVNSLGQVMLTEEITATGSSLTKNLDLSAYPKGSYFFRVVGNSSIETVPFVLK